MARQGTAIIASTIQGDQLYQQRARAALPLLVRQAKSGEPITYQKLANELQMPNARNLNFPLGSIGRSLIALSKQWRVKIPPIQSLVISKSTNQPGRGIEGFFNSSRIKFARLPSKQKKQIIKASQLEVYAFRRWDEVLGALDLEPAPSADAGQIDAAKNFFGGGESENHFRLKKYVCNNPNLVGIVWASSGSCERRLPSGDALDVSFEKAGHWVAIEVKSSKSNHADMVRGVFQCIKYEAVMNAELGATGDFKNVSVLLVLESDIPNSIRALANTLGVDLMQVRRWGNGFRKVDE